MTSFRVAGSLLLLLGLSAPCFAADPSLEIFDALTPYEKAVIGCHIKFHPGEDPDRLAQAFLLQRGALPLRDGLSTQDKLDAFRAFRNLVSASEEMCAFDLLPEGGKTDISAVSAELAAAGYASEVIRDAQKYLPDSFPPGSSGAEPPAAADVLRAMTAFRDRRVSGPALPGLAEIRFMYYVCVGRKAPDVQCLPVLMDSIFVRRGYPQHYAGFRFLGLDSDISVALADEAVSLQRCFAPVRASLGPQASVQRMDELGLSPLIRRQALRILAPDSQDFGKIYLADPGPGSNMQAFRALSGLKGSDNEIAEVTISLTYFEAQVMKLQCPASSKFNDTIAKVLK